MPTTAHWTSPALLAARLLLAGLFVHEGVSKIANYAGSVRYAENFGLPSLSIPAAIAVEIGCGALIVFGVGTRVAALVLALFCLATAAIFHTKLGDINQLLHFEKDIAIAGGLVALAVAGSGRFAVRPG